MFTPPNKSHVTCHVSRVTCHVSHVTCYMSRVTCHVSHVTFFFFIKWWSLSVEGLLSTGPTPSSLYLLTKVYKIIGKKYIKNHFFQSTYFTNRSNIPHAQNTGKINRFWCQNCSATKLFLPNFWTLWFFLGLCGHTHLKLPHVKIFFGKYLVNVNL